MLSEKHIKKQFKEHIIPSITKFVKERHFDLEQNMLRGEFYTLMRRHLNMFTNEKASHKITIHNIDFIGVDKEGNIVSIGFSNTYYEKHSRDKELIDLLNKCLSECQSSFTHSNLSSVLDKIIRKIHYV